MGIGDGTESGEGCVREDLGIAPNCNEISNCNGLCRHPCIVMVCP